MAERTRLPKGTKVRVAYPAKSDARSPENCVYFGAEVEGVVTEDFDEWSGLVEGPHPTDDGETLVQFVGWEWLTPIED